MKLPIIVVVLAELSLTACGPGVVDGTESIGQGYYLADTGGNGRTIEFHGDGQMPVTVVSARVGSYSKRGTTLIAARLPASVVMKDGRAEWKLSNECEYWVIDMKTHATRITTDVREYEGVHCR